ncbi:peroxiredoxin-like family protein [Pontiellaceae bacterium B12219]|nr:peroxiredoxin-like family protein [Pontiellaceae bacterium B12219]
MKTVHIAGALLAVTTLVVSCSKQNGDSDMTAENTDSSLKAQLDARKTAFGTKASDSVKKTYAEGIQAVVDSGVVQHAKQVGDKAPDFELTNASGETVKLSDVLKDGPVVLTWYRGGWCPYCNLALRAMQKELPNFEAAGATLIALTPEVPDQSMSTAEKDELEFEVLSDLNNTVAQEYGIVYTLTDGVATIYEDKFELSAYNGNDLNQLPLAATYVINEDGIITYAFLDADYRNRAEPSDITAALQK